MKSLWWVVLVGVLARTTLICFHPTGNLKRLEPSVIADNLNAGRGFTFEQYGTVYRAWKEPLYIVLLARLTHWAGQEALVALLFHGLCGIGTAVGVTLIARDLFGDPIKATVAGSLAAVNPFLVYYDTHFIHPLSMDACLFIATAGTILLAVSHTRKVSRSIWAGVVMGLTLWQRAALFASGLMSWIVGLVVVPRRDRVAMIRSAAVWLGVSVLVISPWLLRNYRLFGRLIVTTDSAHILWLGNNPWSNGTYSDMVGRRVIALADPAFRARIHGASELAQYDLFLAEAHHFIREQPRQFGALVVRRSWAFFWFSPNAGLEYTAWQGSLYRSGYAGLLSLGLIGLVLHWRRTTPDAHRKVIVLIASVAGLVVVHSVTAINMKHRVPLELVLAVFAAESLTEGFAVVRGRWCKDSRKPF